jgi:2-keto-3-deoxy-L-rhamnonate aldolase RhmA
VPVRPNTTLRALRAERCVIGAETSLFHPGVPLIYAGAGLDFVWIDLEHTLADPERVAATILHARLGGITPIVRVPELRPGLVRPLLDNGAQGIILPFVENATAVRELVSWCRFHPAGKRGIGSPLLANDFRKLALAEHVASDTEVLVAVQVESEAGIEQIDEIVAVEGLDVVIIGLADLSVSYGVPGEVDHPRVVAAAERVLRAAKGSGVAGGVAGIYTPRSSDAAALMAWTRRGARFIQLFGDLSLLTDAARALAATARAALPASKT